MNRKTILIIDTNRSLCTSVQHIFSRTGANVSLVHDEDDGLRELNLLQPELIMISLEPSGSTGPKLLRRIRHTTLAPIIVINGTDASDQAHCLDAGADDFVSKPYDMDVLLARVNAKLRRTEMQFEQRQDAVYDDGHLFFDPVAYQASVGGNRIKLTPTEFRLLSYLVDNAGESCAFNQILESIWGDGFDNHREYVHNYICQLRQKLERDPRRPDYILNVYDIGYRFQTHQYGEVARLQRVS